MLSKDYLTIIKYQRIKHDCIYRIISNIIYNYIGITLSVHVSH